MSLNIKDPEAHRLAKLIANETGATITETVIEALRERLDRLRRNGDASLAADLNAIAERAAKHVRRPYADHGDLLYDEQGLPK